MPYRALDLSAAAEYLHLTRGEVEQLVKTTDIPHARRGGRIVFLRGDLDAWASRRILGLPPKHLADYHRKSTRDTHAIFAEDLLIPALLRPDFINVAMTSRTKKSVIRDLVACADKTGRVLDPAELLASVEAREQICSTALPGGLALLHCRNYQPYRFEGSLIVLGRTVQEIHFGSPDGLPTRLFFLICCQDEHLHLHTLARLCLIAQKTDVIDRLLTAPDAASAYSALLDAEQTALTDRKSTGAGSPA
jgi:excisionase family DNA binding protein